MSFQIDFWVWYLIPTIRIDSEPFFPSVGIMFLCFRFVVRLWRHKE